MFRAIGRVLAAIGRAVAAVLRAVGRLVAEISLPKLVAFEIEGQRAGLAEENINALAVRDWCAAGVTVFGELYAVRIFGQLRRHGFIPEDFARGALDADEMAPEIF